MQDLEPIRKAASAFLLNGKSDSLPVLADELEKIGYPFSKHIEFLRREYWNDGKTHFIVATILAGVSDMELPDSPIVEMRMYGDWLPDVPVMMEREIKMLYSMTIKSSHIMNATNFTPTQLPHDA